MNSRLGRRAAAMAVLLAASFAFGSGRSEAGSAQKPKKKPAKQSYDYDKSKYKAYKVFVGEEPAYRFNSKGEPVRPGTEKGKTSGQQKTPAPAKLPPTKADFPKAEEPSSPKTCPEGESCPSPEEKPKD